MTIAAVVLLLVAGLLVYLFLGEGDGGGAGDGSGSGNGQTSEADPADAALAALPRGVPLPPNTMVVPRDVGGNVDLYVVDADTGATTGQLTTAPEPDVAPLIAPDRETVVFVRLAATGHELWAVATDGSDPRLVFPAGTVDCPSVGRPAWNPADPTQLALPCSGGAAGPLLLVTLDGAVVRSLDPGVPRFADLSFSPDGSRIVYWGTDAPDVDGGPLYSLPVDGASGPVPLTQSGPGIDADPIWSPDGQRIAFRRIIAPNQSRIIVMAADGSAPQQLTSGEGFDQDPAWSPDGGRIAFKSSRPGPVHASGDHIWVMAGTGGDLRQLDGDGVATNAPAWGNR